MSIVKTDAIASDIFAEEGEQVQRYNQTNIGHDDNLPSSDDDFVRTQHRQNLLQLRDYTPMKNKKRSCKTMVISPSKMLKYGNTFKRRINSYSGKVKDARIKYRQIRNRQCPSPLVNVLKNLSSIQKKSLIEMGFECMIEFKISKIPSRLAYWLVDNFNPQTCELKIGECTMEITRDSVHTILGFPLGSIKVCDVKRAGIGNKDVIEEWRKQYPKPANGRQRINFSQVESMVKDDKEGGRMFKLNILVLMMTIMAEGVKCGTVNQKFLPCIKDENLIRDMDWCGYVLDCLKRSKDGWNRDNPRCWYTGPLLFLLVWYVHNTRCKKTEVINVNPPILYWTYKKLKQCQQAELKNGGFGYGLLKLTQQDNMDMVVDHQEASIHKYEVHVEDQGINRSSSDGEDAHPSSTGLFTTVLEHDFDGCDDFAGQTDNFNPKDYVHCIESAYKRLCEVKMDLKNKMQKATLHYPTDEDVTRIIQSIEIKLTDFMTNGPDEQRSMEPLVKDHNKVVKVIMGSGGPDEQKFMGNLEKEFGEVYDDRSVDLTVTQILEERWDELVESAIKQSRMRLKSVDRKEVGKIHNDKEGRSTKHKGLKEDGNIKHDKTPNASIKTPLQCGRFEVNPEFVHPNESDRAFGKRVVKPTAVHMSPYYRREVLIKPKLDHYTLQLTGCIFTAMRAEYDVIFKRTPGVEIGRVIFESLIPECHVHAGVIDAWATILNGEERLRSDGAPKRLFCDTSMISTNMVEKRMTKDGKFNIFKDNLENFLKNYCASIVNYDLVFFPIIRKRHFYLLCFDIGRDELVLIDNINYGDDSLKRYEKV